MNRFVVWIAPFMLLLGCARYPPPAGPATSVDPKCVDPEVWRAELSTVPADAIAGVEGKLYWYTCPGTAQVVGARMLLRADVLGAERRARMLSCHNAHVYLGDEEVASGRPAWLPGGWMDVDVAPAGDDVALTLSADTVPKNIRLLRDVRALARR